LPAGEAGNGPLLLILDNGWPAAPAWDRRIAAAAERIEAAGRRGQTIAVAATSDAAREIIPTTAAHALERLRSIKPLPFVPDRHVFLPAVDRFLSSAPQADVVWIADGLERGGARDFAERLAALSPRVTLVSDSTPVRALAGPRNEGGSFDVSVLRAAANGDSRQAQGIVRALDRKGLAIGEASFSFAGNSNEAKASFDLPVELRNDIARLEIVDERSAGAVSLVDERWKRRRVGIVSGETADLSLPLLAPNYYLTKALAPFADIREARQGATDPIQDLLDENVAVLVLADVGTIAPTVRAKLEQFVNNGGVLLRFAGTRLASSGSDELIPVRLRRGGRVLGGALSWETPKRLAAFDRQSPFYGLDVPNEVTVTRQVLAEPDAGLPAKTWAALADGTPLVTATARGKGMLILFHVTADTTWSNLPISGLFVDMLRKVVSLAGETAKPDQSAANAAEQAQVDSLPPTRVLDGFGALGAPPATAKPVPANFSGIGDAEHPPGFYGPPDAFLAVNTLGAKDQLVAANFSGLNFHAASLREAAPIDLRPPLLVAALVLFILDSLASLWLARGTPRDWRRRPAAAAILLLALGHFLIPAPARAQTQAHTQTQAQPAGLPNLSERDLDSALNTRLAYVISGDAHVDEISRNGLTTLSRALAARTSLTPIDPVGVDPGRDELAFYPMLYWPIVASQPQPPAATVAKIAAFMKQGGTIIFDTRDALQNHPGGAPTPESAWLRQLLDGVDVPELERVPVDHVVTKTFYLIDGFVGRYTNGETWIEALPPPNPNDPARPARSGDDVSPIIITSNDLAAGWAGDANGDSLYPLVPGGNRQHEMALRGGINLVMYTLTGNYKADQVHVRDLLERLAH
jgi:hypothetical protein